MSRTVTAKVKCTSKTIYGSSGAHFEFSVDYASGKNKEWAQATPTLSVKMSVANEALFEVGKPYTLAFTEDEGE